MRRLPCRVGYDFPTNNFGELSFNTGRVCKRDVVLGILDLAYEAFNQRFFNRFRVNSSSDIPTTSVVGI